jgi:DNA-binding NtrC family response regulator
MAEPIVESSTEEVLNVARTGKTKVLHVDDDQAFLSIAKQCLEMQGEIDVDTVSSVNEASEKSRFDLALIDIKLPDMEGTELLHRLKEEQPHMAKIIIAGFPTLENAMKTVNEGADGYILKPFDIDKLLEMIKKHLTKKTAEHISNWMEFDRDNTRKSRFDRKNAKRKSFFEQQ